MFFKHVSVMCVCSAYGGQKMALDLLELGLKTIVGHHVGGWTEPNALNNWMISAATVYEMIKEGFTCLCARLM